MLECKIEGVIAALEELAHHPDESVAKKALNCQVELVDCQELAHVLENRPFLRKLEGLGGAAVVPAGEAVHGSC